VDGTGTLRSAYNYDAYLTTGSRTSDFKFLTSYNDNTLPADQTLRKNATDFEEVFGDIDSSPEVKNVSKKIILFPLLTNAACRPNSASVMYLSHFYKIISMSKTLS
jgi:hypothetical protein